MPHKSVWDADLLQRVKAMWDDGLPPLVISEKVGKKVSPTAITQKLYREYPDMLGTAAPIFRRDKVSSPLTAPLPPLPDYTPRPDAPKPVIAAPIPVHWWQIPLPPVRFCCWPLGEPGTKSFRFCDDAVISGKPYCGDHADLAYVKLPA